MRGWVVTDRGPDGTEKVELSHEALILEWDRLRDWLETDRVFRVWQQQMWLSARHWRESGNDPAALLRGGRLAEAERWVEERDRNVSPAALTYIAASVEDRKRREMEEAAQRAAALNQMTALAESESKRANVEAQAKRRLSLLTAGLAAAALLLLGVTFFALQAQRMANEQRQQAEANAKLALSRQLGAQAVHAAETNVDLASLLSLEMLKLSESEGDVNEMFARLELNPLLTTLLYGADTPLYGLAFTADGQRLVGGTEHGDILSWDLATQQPARGIPNQGAIALGFSISPRGDRLIVVDGAVCVLYDALTMQEIARLQGHPSDIVRAAFTYDGSRLFTTDGEYDSRLWDADTGAFIMRLPIDVERDVFGPISADGAIVALGDHPGDEDALDLWNTKTMTQTGARRAGHISEINNLAVSPDGQVIATTSNDGTTRLWNAKTGAPQGEPLRGHVGRVLFSTFSPDSEVLATGGTDNKVLLWNIETGTQLGPPLVGHGNWVRTGAFSPDGRTLATGDADGRVLLWNVARSNPLQGHTQRARSAAISPDGNTLVTGGFDHQLIVRDAATLKQRRVMETEHPNAIIQVAFSPDGKSFASVDAGGGMVLWDPATWQPRQALNRQRESVLLGLAYSPDSRELAAGAFDGTIQFWDVVSGQPKGTPIAAHSNWVMALAYSPNGDQLVSGSKDGVISRWNAKTYELIDTVPTAHTNWVTDLAFAPDGAAFVSASADGSMRVWDAVTGAPIGTPLVADGNQIWSVSFDKSYNPAQLVSLGGDGTIYWWDWAQRRLARPPLRTGKETEEMVLSSDGRLVVLGAVDTDAFALRLSRVPWADLACQIANRALSADEWKTYMGDLPYSPSCVGPG
ncbi:MAG: hypothetical protein IPK16_01125 [Anaerolineales bacterium]|nr:hypothetical protein [Anaerolineales bacterium]